MIWASKESKRDILIDVVILNTGDGYLKLAETAAEGGGWVTTGGLSPGNATEGPCRLMPRSSASVNNASSTKELQHSTHKAMTN